MSPVVPAPRCRSSRRLRRALARPLDVSDGILPTELHSTNGATDTINRRELERLQVGGRVWWVVGVRWMDAGGGGGGACIAGAWWVGLGRVWQQPCSGGQPHAGSAPLLDAAGPRSGVHERRLCHPRVLP